jgi:hypothetical protein
MGYSAQTDGPATPSGPQTPPPGSPSTRLAIAVLAGVSCLAAVDLAVETLLAGSPARWVAAGTLALGGAAGLMLRKKLSASAVAWGALFLTLGLLAVSSWLPGGTTAGAVWFRQPTSTVLSAVVAAGVVLGAVKLARLRVMPLPGRAAVALIAAYGLWALVWGIVLHTPYPGLFHGQSAWQRLPFWLQGAFVGCALLMPAGLVAHLLAVRASLTQGRFGAWAGQGVALALIVAIGCSGFVSGTGSSVSPGLTGGTASGPVIVQAFPDKGPLSEFPGGKPATYEESVARLARLNALIQKLADLVDPAAVDVAERARRNGPDLESNFAFVRDTVRFEPYAGSMRGAQGALISSSANSLDRSLLLAGLLEAHGHKARIARGTLASDKVEMLAKAFLGAKPRAAEDPGPKIAQVVRDSGEPDMLSVAEANRPRGERVRQWINGRAASDAAALRAALGDSQTWFRDGASKDVQQRLADHFWIQVERGDQWVDMDTSFAGAKHGQRFAEPSGAFAPSEMPGDLSHRIRVSAVAEYAEGDERRETKVLDVTVPAADLVVHQMRLTNEPVDVGSVKELGRAHRFRASLHVGPRMERGEEYTLGGPAPAGDRPDLGAALFGGEDAPRKLSGLWTEISMTGPGAPGRAERRYLVDLVGADARSRKGRGRVLRDVPKDRLPYLALGVQDIVVMPAPYPGFMVHWLTCRSAIENQQLMRVALDVKFKKAAPGAVAKVYARSGASPFSPALASMAGLVAEHLDAQGGASRPVMVSPFVAAFKQGLSAESVIKDPPDRARLRTGFDIVSTAAVPIGGSAAERAERGLLFGAFLTDLELAMGIEMLPGGAAVVENASAAAEASRGAGQAIGVVRETGEESRLGLTADAQAALRSDVQAGHMVVAAPARTSGSANSIATWWRVNPDTGVSLGVNELGEGQGMTEEQLLNFTIALAGAVWCQVKVARKDLNEAGQAVGTAVCMAGWALGVYAAFVSVAWTAIVALAVGMVGDICDTN